ncbi:sulfotransferase family protein [Nocardioides sp. MAHUQ-72]|uniref:sulfotransferase family protein n=1 Tax=unclassified Nocardioides TaxID=2615069 RepID=UPI003611A473
MSETDVTEPGRRAAVARPRVLLIVGSGRSGSTLFERALGGVPGVAALGEIVHMWDRAVRDDELCGCGLPFGDCPFWSAVGMRAFHGWDRVAVDELVRARQEVVRTRHVPQLLATSPSAHWRAQRDTLARDLGAVLSAASRESGAQLLVDSSKMPAYAALLMRADVDLRCVEVVRDPRGVAYSLRKSVQRPEVTDGVDLMHRTGVAQSALWWSAFDVVTGLLRAVGRVPFTTVRYEDFVADPSGTVARVLDFAGLPAGADSLRHIDGDRLVLGTNHQVAGNPVRFRTGEVQVRVDEEWRRELSIREQRTVTFLTAGLRNRHRYR